MKTRHVFGTPDLATAEAAIRAARQAGVADEDISLIARHDIEKKAIPGDRQETGGDFATGGAKGVMMGGGSGLVAGIIAVTIVPIGLTLAGIAAMTLVGAAVGGWVGMLAGTAVPDPVRRKFEDDIAAGRILVVIDGEDEILAAVDPVMRAAGAVPMPFDAPTAMT